MKTCDNWMKIVAFSVFLMQEKWPREVPFFVEVIEGSTFWGYIIK